MSIITGGGKWVEVALSADPLYQHLLITAQRKFWRCVETGEPPRLFGIEPPRPRLAAVRVVDMSASNSWAELATIFRNTRQAFLARSRTLPLLIAWGRRLPMRAAMRFSPWWALPGKTTSMHRTW